MTSVELYEIYTTGGLGLVLGYVVYLWITSLQKDVKSCKEETKEERERNERLINNQERVNQSYLDFIKDIIRHD